jgi:hypothetical protein
MRAREWLALPASVAFQRVTDQFAIQHLHHARFLYAFARVNELARGVDGGHHDLTTYLWPAQSTADCMAAARMGILELIAEALTNPDLTRNSWNTLLELTIETLVTFTGVSEYSKRFRREEHAATSKLFQACHEEVAGFRLQDMFIEHPSRDDTPHLSTLMAILGDTTTPRWVSTVPCLADLVPFGMAASLSRDNPEPLSKSVLFISRDNVAFWVSAFSGQTQLPFAPAVVIISELLLCSRKCPIIRALSRYHHAHTVIFHSTITMTLQDKVLDFAELIANPSVEVLQLPSFNMTRERMKVLASSVERNTNLRRINVPTLEDLDVFFEAAARHPSLEHIDGCVLPEEVTSNLKRNRNWRQRQSLLCWASTLA